MAVYAARVAIYVMLPLLVAAGVKWLGASVRTRSHGFEVYLIYMLGLGVAGSSIGGAFGHLLLSDLVAEAVGWGGGSPFQLEMGFASLTPGNTLQNVANLAKRILPISFLRASRRSDLRSGQSPEPGDAGTPLAARHGSAVGWLIAIVSTGFGVGYAVDRPLEATLVGVLAGVLSVWAILHRSPGAT